MIRQPFGSRTPTTICESTLSVFRYPYDCSSFSSLLEPFLTVIDILVRFVLSQLDVFFITHAASKTLLPAATDWATGLKRTILFGALPSTRTPLSSRKTPISVCSRTIPHTPVLAALSRAIPQDGNHRRGPLLRISKPTGTIALRFSFTTPVFCTSRTRTSPTTGTLELWSLVETTSSLRIVRSSVMMLGKATL